MSTPADLCHNGHPFEPGLDADALDEPGDPRWCDVCGEARRLVHLLNAYTWAGRRGGCAVTSEWLSCTRVLAEVTCPRCLAAVTGGSTPSASPAAGTSEDSAVPTP